MPLLRKQQGGDLCAIYVHAGAGYHSHQNEQIHLSAVNDAAKVAMTILKNGGDATDAVELAIRILEDREITNAGYGSNLTIDGLVECDATLVDHFGRSGAVGAVSQIKNPISLARVVLQESTKPLSLQRVPPNLLVGQGATRFAVDHNIDILPHDYLISHSARERYTKWHFDLVTAQAKVDEKEQFPQLSRQPASSEFETNTPKVMMSPPVTPSMEVDMSQLSSASAAKTPSAAYSAELRTSESGRYGQISSSYTSLMPPFTPMLGDHKPTVQQSPLRNTNHGDAIEAGSSKRKRVDGSFDGSGFDDNIMDTSRPLHMLEVSDRDDHITDTVGAIAIDCFGNIAAGSSSGGIGMKHSGRCGPAALVGIGTCVIPIDPQDPDRVCVATVTSGTGEHMATTTAAATAASRIYDSVRKDKGKYVDCSEDEALNSMIKNDFMRHPGVRNSHCAGAIGVLAVKKTRNGIFFYFGHNTDSFALASMHSEERKPVCTMSRSKGNGSVAQGGRVSRAKNAKR